MSGIAEELDSIIKSKEFTGTHFNFEPEIEYKVSTGSLKLDLALGGGISNGIIRFTGNSEAGKTEASLEIARNFQIKFGDEAFVLYIKAEGRLPQDKKDRSGIDQDPNKFFVFRSNLYEPSFDLIERIIKTYKGKKKIMVIVDSLNSLVTRENVNKSYSENPKTMSAAALNSMAMARLGSPINELGHMLILISQIREQPSLSKYEESKQRGYTKGTGGNALIHAPNTSLGFEKRNKGDYFKEDEGKPLEAFANEGLGHMVKITIEKCGNEKTLNKVTYPIRYGIKNGSSVWTELEVFEFLKTTKLVVKGGAWYTPSDYLKDKIEEKKLKGFDKIQGEKNFLAFLESNPKTKDYLFELIVEYYNAI
tara:strand:- start:12041 stop:13135 length:1095 start_codon:yes stop_codon:yes gene_type:complete